MTDLMRTCPKCGWRFFSNFLCAKCGYNINLNFPAGIDDGRIAERDVEELILLNFSPEELAFLKDVLRPFHATARAYAVRLFIRARLCKKTFVQTVNVLWIFWRDVWANGTPNRLADPDDVTVDSEGHTRGMKNTKAFCSAYKWLGIPFNGLLF